MATPRKTPRMLTLMPRERVLSWHLGQLIDAVNRLSALGHEGTWPAAQVVPAWHAALLIEEHASAMTSMLRGWEATAALKRARLEARTRKDDTT